MIKPHFTYPLIALVLFFFVHTSFAQSDSIIEKDTSTVQIDTPNTTTKKTVYKFDIHQEIGPAAWRITERAIDAAEEQSADYILIDLDTYGGLVTDADNIRTKILKTEIPVLIFIRNNAASAGALISIACDSIYMSPGSTIGAAAVVDAEGTMAPEKYQSYMRNKMRATAEETGRDPDIAEGMVDPTVVIPGVSDSTEIITFSVDEALKNGYCNGKVENVDEALKMAGVTDYDITEHQVSGVEKIINFLVNPVVSGILMLMIVGGIWFELQSPGVGFPIAAALVGALLYFAPHYLEGLAAHWEIALFVVGIILLAVELFVIPGFGFAGISGIACVVTGLTLSLIRNINFDFSFVPGNQIVVSLMIVLGVMMLSMLSMIVLGSRLSTSGGFFKRVALPTEQKKEDGYVISAAISDKNLIGKEGVAITDLRPSGKIEIDGEWHDAQSDAEYIKKDSKVKVEKVQGAYLVVSEILST